MKETSKYWQIFECLRKGIRDGVYAGGGPLPSEESIVRKFNVSRITAIRAMDELVKCGLVYRKRGAGTFATKTPPRRILLPAPLVERDSTNRTFRG